MTVFKTKNGVFATSGSLEKSGLAVAVNLENILLKLKKMDAQTWEKETEKLISKKIHTVLAQCDKNAEYPGRMLNAGGLLTLVTPESEGSKPLGMLMGLEKDKLQLGFGKVELQDLDPQLKAIQTKLDNALKTVLTDLLKGSKTKEEFMEKIQKSEEILFAGSMFEKILQEEDKTIAEIFTHLDASDKLASAKSSFGRPDLNKYTVHALKNAAVREINEEIQFTVNGQAIDASHFNVVEMLNRGEATEFVKSVLNAEGLDKSKFSAKEFNKDFESITFVVNCTLSVSQLKQLVTQEDCMLITPSAVSIKVIDPNKGILQTSMAGFPDPSGGGNQYSVALFCHQVLKLPVQFTPMRAASPTMFTPQPNVGASASAAAAEPKKYEP